MILTRDRFFVLTEIENKEIKSEDIPDSGRGIRRTLCHTTSVPVGRLLPSAAFFFLMLDDTEIRQALAELDAALARRGVKGEVCLFGGAVMVLAFRARQSTRDVDAVFAPTTVIREAVAEVGQERGWAEDWLNDGVKGWISERQDVRDAGLNLPFLSVAMPVPEYLLAMKCLAARADQGSRDLDDVKFLIRHLGLTNPAAVLAIVEDYYPPNRLAVKTRYFVEVAFEELAAESSSEISD